MTRYRWSFDIYRKAFHEDSGISIKHGLCSQPKGRFWR